MADKFKIGDIVEWSKDWIGVELGYGPYRIIQTPSSERPQYQVVNADGSPLLDDEVADGLPGKRYYVVAEYEIRKNVFLTAVSKAAGLSTTNSSVKEKQ